MINIFASGKTYLFLAFLFLHLTIIVALFYKDFGISNPSELIVEGLYNLIAGFLVFGSTILYAVRTERKRLEKEQQDAIVNVAIYIGSEILDNIAEIDKILENNAKTEKEMPTPPDEIARKYARGGMWAASATMLEVNLTDKWHQNLVKSGLITKIPTVKLTKSIRESYQELDNLKKRLMVIPKFYSMLNAPPPSMTQEFILDLLNNKLDKGIDMAIEDIQIYKQQAGTTIELLNALLRPYGEELKIIKH